VEKEKKKQNIKELIDGIYDLAFETRMALSDACIRLSAVAESARENKSGADAEIWKNLLCERIEEVLPVLKNIKERTSLF